MRTITQTAPHTFTEALQKLVSGECVGIRPNTNTNFVVAFRPHWMNQNSPDFMLVWCDSDARSPDAMIRSNQFLETWFLVVIDHRTLNVGPST
jgi:hypothetical protein